MTNIFIDRYSPTAIFIEFILKHISGSLIQVKILMKKIQTPTWPERQIEFFHIMSIYFAHKNQPVSSQESVLGMASKTTFPAYIF